MGSDLQQGQSSLLKIQSSLFEIQIYDEDNQLIGLPTTTNGKFNCFETWEAIRMNCTVVDSWKGIWFSGHIPKHSFISWIAIKDRLITRYRMAKWGYKGEMFCIFCRSRMELKNCIYFFIALSPGEFWKEI